AQECQQLRFGSIEVAVEEIAYGRTTQCVPRLRGRVSIRAALFASRNLSLAHQPVQDRHDRRVREWARLSYDLADRMHVALLQSPQGAQACQFQGRRNIAKGARHLKSPAWRAQAPAPVSAYRQTQRSVEQIAGARAGEVKAPKA